MPLHPCSSLHRATSMTVRMYAGGATRFEAGQVENTSIDVRDASSIMVPHPVQRQGIPRMTLCPYLASLRVQNRLSMDAARSLVATGYGMRNVGVTLNWVNHAWISGIL